jgi:transglutaminase-like putative cysteine protease
MNFRPTYRVSSYLMLFFATLVLSVDATDLNRLALLYPVAVAVAAGAAYFTVDRHPQLGLSPYTTNLLALGAIAAAVFEHWYDENLSLLALGHFFVYMQLLFMFRPKSTKGEWYLFLMGLAQVLLGCVMSQSDVVGISLFAWALCSLWVLGLFTLDREAERAAPAPGTTLSPAVDPEMPYPSLIDASFLMASVRVAAMTLALGGIIFLFMPRKQSSGTTLRTDVLGKHLTGFDDVVQLGQLGEILENESVVMTVELTDYPSGRRYHPPDEPLWRGVALSKYERGRWRKMMWRAQGFPPDVPRPSDARPMIRQQIKIEPTDNPTLFALRPILWADSSNRRLPPEFNSTDGSIHRADSRPIALEYVVISAADATLPQEHEQFPPPNVRDDLLSIPPDLKAQLRPIAEAQLRGVDRTDRTAVARKLEWYLRDSGQFGYTLQMEVRDPGIDPVADFLINRKEGHCEYFASALTLLLRAVDVPARMVNGFKGGDWNELAQVMSVREKHAHTWCEALLTDRPTGRTRTPRWMVLDPTPGTERDRSVAQVGGMFGGVRQVTDFVRYIWTFYIVGFNSERQQRFLYEPIRRLLLEARRGFRMMGQGLRDAFSWMFHFRDVSSFFSPRGFVASFLGLSLLALLIWAGRAVARRLRRSWGASRARDAGLAAGVLFYRRLVSLLEEFGLERPDAETPREFARRAAGFLAGHGSGNESVADVPPLVVDAYYRIRFGHLDLDTDALRVVESRLDALEARLRPATA